MKKRFIIQLFILIQVVSLSAQTRYYVNHAATGQNTGLTWQDAYTDLHQALDMALAGDEIWVAEGECWLRVEEAEGRRVFSSRLVKN